MDFSCLTAFKIHFNLQQPGLPQRKYVTHENRVRGSDEDFAHRVPAPGLPAGERKRSFLDHLFKPYLL